MRIVALIPLFSLFFPPLSCGCLHCGCFCCEEVFIQNPRNGTTPTADSHGPSPCLLPHYVQHAGSPRQKLLSWETVLFTLKPRCLQKPKKIFQTLKNKGQNGKDQWPTKSVYVSIFHTAHLQLQLYRPLQTCLFMSVNWKRSSLFLILNCGSITNNHGPINVRAMIKKGFLILQF